ncbi:MAG: hypothetical protein K2N51_17995 [Lachnospiraceae bacterium]|nr:hypothetical protein [Lachnospiraceae bacterium]
MGEVLEISCIIKNKDHIINLYEYMKNIPNNENLSEEIEMMDNWCWENVSKLDSFNIDTVIEYAESKIILITEQMIDGSKGLDIEAISRNCYNVEIWFNKRDECYDDIMNDLLQLIFKNIIEDIYLIAIGREILFDYDDDFLKMDKKSHSIDTWIISEKYFRNKCITTYHEYDIQKRIIEKNVIFVMSLQKRNS